MGVLYSRDKSKEEGVSMTDWWEETLEEDFASVKAADSTPTIDELPVPAEKRAVPETSPEPPAEIPKEQEPAAALVRAFEKAIRLAGTEAVPDTTVGEGEPDQKCCCRWI